MRRSWCPTLPPRLSAFAAKCRKVAALGQQLMALNATLEARMDADMLLQFEAACVALSGCSLLAQRLPLQRNDAFRLVGALQLVFHTGLEVLVSNSPVPEVGRLAYIPVMLAECQVTAAETIINAACTRHEPQAAAAFLRAAGRPKTVRVWLHALSRHLLMCHSMAEGGQGEACPMAGLQTGTTYYALTATRADTPGALVNALVNFAAFMKDVFSGPPGGERAFGAYAEALLGQPATQHSVMAVLLDCCLPLLVRASSPEAHHDLKTAVDALLALSVSALEAPALEAALVQQMSRPGSEAYLQQALQVIAALPLSPGDDAGVHAACERQAAATSLLAALCCPHVSDDAIASARAAAAWPFVRALPQMLARLTSLANSCSHGIPDDRLAVLCHRLAMAAEMLLQRPPGITTDDDLGAWAAAAAALVQALPAMRQLGNSNYQPLQQALQLLLSQLQNHLLARGANAAALHIKRCTSSAQARQTAPVSSQATKQLQQLHSTLCRLCHASPADGQILLPISNGLLRYVLMPMATCGIEHGLLRCTRPSAICLHSALGVTAGAPAPCHHSCSDRAVHGMLLAHGQALQAASAGEIEGRLTPLRQLSCLICDCVLIGQHCPLWGTDDEASLADLLFRAVQRAAEQFPQVCAV